MNVSANGFARETTFIEDVALQGNPFASQVGHAAADSSEAIHTQEAAAKCWPPEALGGVLLSSCLLSCCAYHFYSSALGASERILAFQEWAGL
jgi:hypothetical protein